MSQFQARSQIEHFIPPTFTPYPGALRRYLTRLPENVLSAYVDTYSQPGDVVLDPFAHSDAVARVSAQTGRKTVLSDLNPLTVFVTRASLLAVSGRELQMGFEQLAAAKQAEVPLATHLDDLYTTDCPRCGAKAVATSFVWDRKIDGPLAKRCVCSACAENECPPGELTPINEADVVRLREIDARGFHYWYIVDRFGHGREGHRELAMQLLDLYTRRNAYALATLVRHIEAGKMSKNVQQLLKLVLLDCLCSCSKLEALTPPSFVGSDIDLRPPTRFVERNVWRRFAAACVERRALLENQGGDTSPPRLGASVARVLETGTYTRLGTAANTIVLRQAARNLSRDLAPESVALVLSAPPGPSHGPFLCLSYLWSGWLLGEHESQGIEQIPCSRRPLDWLAYYRAIAAALRGLAPTLKCEAPLIFHFEAETRRQCDMLALGGLAAGLALRRVLFQPAVLPGAAVIGQEGAGRYVLELFKPAAEPAAVDLPASGAAGLEAQIRQQAELAIKDSLAERAEPSPYTPLHLAVLQHLGRSGMLLSLLAARGFDGVAVAEALDEEVVATLERGERRRQLLKHEGKGPLWSLARPAADETGLGDRVEWATYTLLSNSRLVPNEKALRDVHAQFTGLATPEPGLVEDCLASYGRRTAGGEWTLAERDRLVKRVEEHSLLLHDLVGLGRRFGYKIWLSREEQRRPYGEGTLGQLLTLPERYASPASLFGGVRAADVDVIWYDGRSEVWLFEMEWTAMVAPAVLGRRLPVNARRFLVVLEERVPLIQSKLRRGPWLQRALDADGWQFLRAQRLRSFVADAEANPQGLSALAGLRAPADGASGQLPLLLEDA
ncbi:MAG: DNA methyltransferase [Chloroflexota bacterium]